MRIALTRRPSPELERCELEFLSREPIDYERALEQHAAYGRALEGMGMQVIELPTLAGFPDATFVEDPAVVLDEVAILTRPGPESRRGEIEGMDAALVPYRKERLHLSGNSTLEGGDVLAIEDVLYVGQSTRTNHAGLKELAHLVLPHGYRVKAVTVKGCLHLKTGATWLERDVLLVHSGWIDVDRLPEMERVEVDPGEPFGANALAREGVVLLSASAPRTAERVAARGFEVRMVDVSEFEKAEAGVTCLSLVLGTPQAESPSDPLRR